MLACERNCRHYVSGSHRYVLECCALFLSRYCIGMLLAFRCIRLVSPPRSLQGLGGWARAVTGSERQRMYAEAARRAYSLLVHPNGG